MLTLILTLTNSNINNSSSADLYIYKFPGSLECFLWISVFSVLHCSTHSFAQSHPVMISSQALPTSSCFIGSQTNQ